MANQSRDNYDVHLPGHLPGVATPVLLKHLCSHRVSRTSVLEETHPRLFQSLETVHGTCIHCVMIQTVPSVDYSFREEMPSHFQFTPVFSVLA